MNRREMLKKVCLVSAGIMISAPSAKNRLNYIAMSYHAPLRKNIDNVIAHEFSSLPTYLYEDVSHEPISWKNISPGLDFSRTKVYRKNELVDIIATVKVAPKLNRINVFNGYSDTSLQTGNINAWQSFTGATATINGSQYMSKPAYKPCAVVIQDGIIKGPLANPSVRGMLVSEPIDRSYPAADLLDFDYDIIDIHNTPYTQGMQHWPILLDREGKIKVQETSAQANRSIVAKDKDNNILLMTTEGGYFTLHNLGRFLKESNERKERGFNVHTAMNLDGGYEACMCIKNDVLSYSTYGEFETKGVQKDETVFGAEAYLPGVIGVFPR
jgi:hypothetical protein